MRTVWKGSISFGLVSIPVKLYGATEEKDISFHQVHAADGGRIKYQRVCSIDGAEVPYAEIAKGFERPDGDTVLLTDEDFSALPIATLKTVEVLTFVPADQINVVALSKAYYVEPSADAKPYVLLRETLVRTGRVAVVKIAMRQRERLATLRAQGNGLVLQTMLWPDEIRQAPEQDLGKVAVRDQEIAMAASFVEALSADFDPDAYHDDYREAVLEVANAKAGGSVVNVDSSGGESGGKVLDLMEALRASVAAASGNGSRHLDTVQPDPTPAKSKRAAAKGGAGQASEKVSNDGSDQTEPRTSAPRKAIARKSTSSKPPTKKAPAKKSTAKTA